MDEEQTGASNNYMEEEEEADAEQGDSENNSLHTPLLKRNGNLNLSSNPLATVGAKVSPIESLDYEWLLYSLLSFLIPI